MSPLLQCVCGTIIDHEDCACSLRDGDCIRIDGSGSALNPYHPEPVFDTDEDNLMTDAGDGLLVELPLWMRNPDRCQVYHSANQSTSHNIGKVLEFDSERYDSTATMHSTTSDNERVYIRTSGVYIITFAGAFAANATGGRQVLIRKNGKEYIAGVHRGAASASFETGLNVVTQEWLEEGEFLTVGVKQTSTTTLNFIGGAEVLADLHGASAEVVAGMRPFSKLCGVCQTTFGNGTCVHLPGAGSLDDPFVPTPVVSDDEDNLVSCGPNGIGAFLPSRYRELPAVHLFSVITQAVPYGVHWPLVWDQVRYDTDTMFDEENDPGSITFKTAGLYLISLNVRWHYTDDADANGVLAAYIRKGDSQFLVNDTMALPEGSGVGGSGAYNKHSVSTLRPFQAGESVKAWVYQSIKDGEDNPRNMRVTVERWSPIFSAVMVRQLAGMDVVGMPESE